MNRFEQYLKDFPNGANALSVRYSLALLYTQTAQDNKAFPLYDFVAKAASIHAEAALVAYIKLQLEKGFGENPEAALKQLLSRSQDPANKAYALSNLMRLSYENQSLEAALNYAQSVMALAEVPEEIKQDAQIMLARGAHRKGDVEAAIAGYASLKEVASGALVAESLYWLAYYKNASANYETSNELILELASDYGAYKMWSAKGLLLMGDNFFALEDLFQAQYLWQNVLENFPQYPELMREAETKIAQLEDAKLNEDTDA
jgi:predicted negative regulator of RcsB-dependent stress response